MSGVTEMADALRAARTFFADGDPVRVTLAKAANLLLQQERDLADLRVELNRRPIPISVTQSPVVIQPAVYPHLPAPVRASGAGTGGADRRSAGSGSDQG